MPTSDAPAATAGSTPTPLRARTRLCTRLCSAIPPVACAVGLCGIALAVTIRDAMPLLAPLHYATPPLAILALALLGGALAWRARRRGVGIANLCTAVAAAVLVATTAWCDSAQPDAVPTRATRVVFWNVFGARLGADAVAAHLVATGADALFLVEAGPTDVAGQTALDAALRAALPGHTLLRAPHRIVAIARGDLRRVAARDLRGGGSAVRFELRLDGDAPLTVVVADIDSNPVRARGPALAELRAWVEPLATSRALVVGDFNTPRRSVHFDAWRPAWRHAFETAGHGLDGTWPAWLPVLSLDHVWVARGCDPVRCTTRDTTASDHRLVEVDLR